TTSIWNWRGAWLPARAHPRWLGVASQRNRSLEILCPWVRSPISVGCEKFAIGCSALLVEPFQEHRALEGCFIQLIESAIARHSDARSLGEWEARTFLAYYPCRRSFASTRSIYQSTR